MSELHPARAIIHPLHRATDPDGPVAEKEGTGGPNNLLTCWSRREGSNLRPADYESCARASRINNFKHLGVQDAAKRDIS